MFIAIEGGDGAGKSTVQLAIKQHFIRAGKSENDIILTSDLAGTALGERIRELFLSDSLDTDDDTNMLLMTAARVQSLKEKIIPALDSKKIVITDRYIDTTFAYQVHSGSGSAQLFRSACESILPVYPDITLILDLDPEIGIERAVKRGVLDKVERKGVEFASKVREGLLSRAYLPGRVVINANQSPERVVRDCVDAITKHMTIHKKFRSPSSDSPAYG